MFTLSCFNTFLTSQFIEIKSAFKDAFNMHLYNHLQYGFDCPIILGHIDNSQQRQGKREPWMLIALMKSMHSTVTSSTGGNHLEQPAFKTLENSREEKKEQAWWQCLPSSSSSFSFQPVLSSAFPIWLTKHPPLTSWAFGDVSLHLEQSSMSAGVW